MKALIIAAVCVTTACNRAQTPASRRGDLPESRNASSASTQPGVPVGVELTQLGAFVPEPVYDPQIHQQALKRPRFWCGAERRNDPLLTEARQIVSARPDEAFAHFRRTHVIRAMSPNVVRFVRDERLCEQAAKAFDRSHIRASSCPITSAYTRHLSFVLAIHFLSKRHVREAGLVGRIL